MTQPQLQPKLDILFASPLATTGRCASCPKPATVFVRTGAGYLGYCQKCGPK